MSLRQLQEMEELLKNEVVRAKIKSLSTPVRKAFIESLLDLYEQETEEMIDVIEESRLELRGDFMSFEDESRSLRDESKLLEERRQNHDSECVKQYVEKKGMTTSRSESRLSIVDEQTNSKAVSEYIKKRGKRKPPLAEMITRSHSTDPGSRRSDSAMSTRSLPTPVNAKTVEEEKEALMKNLSAAHEQNEAERLRQKELIAKRRAARKAQKKSTEEKALELLEKALEMDKQIKDKKMEHDSKIKERLEDMKRKRAESRMGTMLDMNIKPDKADRADKPAKSEDGETASGDSAKRKEEKKEKKEKKHKDKEGKKDKSDKHKSDKKEKDKSSKSDAKKEDKALKDDSAVDYDFAIY